MHETITYRHHFKAGNVGDVWKHAALVALLQSLPPGPRRVLDTHAGAGRYRLDSTGEWTAGIGRLDATPFEGQPLAVQHYRELAGHRQPNRGGWYPGSPRFIRTFLREGDELVLVELLAEPRETLASHFANDPLVTVRDGDGFAALAADRFDLAFIDPPYVERDEWDRVGQAVVAATQRGTRSVVWYPIKALTRPAGLINRIRAAGVPALAVDVITGDLEKKKKALAGSGMLITDPPAGLAARWSEVAAAVAPALASEGAWSVRVQAWDAHT